MKRKEKESLKNMSSGELQAQLRDTAKQLFQMKFKRSSSPLENPVQIRTFRRKAALVRTILRARDIAAEAEVKK